MKIKRKVTLIELGAGKLFLYNGAIALKTDYRTELEAVEAYIVGTGEFFWGGTSSAEEQHKLEVIELELDF